MIACTPNPFKCYLGVKSVGDDLLYPGDDLSVKRSDD